MRIDNVIDRKYLLSMLLAAMLLEGCAGYKVYSVNERPKYSVSGGILYALPRTRVVVDVTLLSRDRSEAPYAQFASEMVGANDSAAMFCASVNLKVCNEADPRAYYYVVPKRIAVDVDKNHLLHSVGLSRQQANSIEESASVVKSSPKPQLSQLEYNLYDHTDTFYTKGDVPGHPSLLSAKPDVRSLRKRARDAAEELKDVQERLRGLEHGEFDESYTVEQLAYVRQRLQQRQSELLRLFVGTADTHTIRYSYVPKDEYTMVDSQRVVLFYFSPTEGIVDSVSGGVPVYCQVRCENQSRSAARFVKFRTDGRKNTLAVKRSGFKYRMAEQAEVMVVCEYFKASAVLPIVQFGPTVDLPNRNFQALFDSRTGDLLYFNGRP